jgi:peptide/nickel transport system substrate-binding protein
LLSLGAVAAGAAMMLAAGVARSADSPDAGTLRISSSRDIDAVDPGLASSSLSWFMEFGTCAKLYSYPDASGRAGTKVVPEVAANFPTLSADGKTATIRLVSSYRFHTGDSVTAANYVAAFNRDANPKMQSPATTYLHEIAGADAVIHGSAATIAGVKALGPYVLQIRTTRPLPDLPARLTMPYFCPIAVDTPIDPDGIDNPLGSGPFYVSSRVRNRLVLLERNPFYGGPRRAHVAHVVWDTGVGQEACRAAVERDESDYCADGAPPGDYAEIARMYGVNRPGGQFFVNPRLGSYYFAFNHDRLAFRGVGQIPLKRAINYVLDRPALVRAAGFRAGQPTDQILPSAMTRDANIYPVHGADRRSLATARALLAKASFKPKRLVLYTANIEPLATWGQRFQVDLRRLGISVEVKYFAIDVLDQVLSVRGAPFDVAVNRWIVDYADPIGYFRPLLDGRSISAKGNANLAYFDRPAYNREIARIDRLRGEARRHAFADLDIAMMRDDPPWAPILVQAWRDFVSKSFGCYVYQPVIARADLVSACVKRR